MENLYIVIPAYNEEENIDQCINEWYSIIENHPGEDNSSRLVVIDDGSTDSTYDKLLKLSQSRHLLIPLKKTNGGHGSAVLYGYHYAINHKANWIFQTDSDGQTNPEEFEEFWKKRNQYDAILGNRKVRGDGRARKLVENVVCLILKIVFKIKVPDANAPFRLMKSELIGKYINIVPYNFNIPNIVFTALFVYFHEKVLFLPITFKPRENGKNSINIKKIIKIGMKAVIDLKKIKKEIES